MPPTNMDEDLMDATTPQLPLAYGVLTLEFR
jgi:hypothetical protein